MPDTVLDAICERLKHRLYINNTIIIREGYPVSRSFFLLRGQLQSTKSNKGRSAAFEEEVILGKGDFVGEELLVYFIEKYATVKATRSLSKLMRSEWGELADDTGTRGFYLEDLSQSQSECSE